MDIEASPVYVELPYGEMVNRRYGYLFAKRLFDFLSATMLMVALSPFVLVCLLVKYFEDGHNPIYRSQRVGQGGRLFWMLKIRTMVPGADGLKDSLIEQGLNEADGPAFKMKNDPRITPFGRFLRKYSIDEVLQLLSVIKGDMSVVGPRPPLPREVESYTEAQMGRLSVKGGLLCLWQIQPHRHEVTFDDWVRYDLEYIERRGVWLDLKIIAKGAFMVLSGKSGD